MVGCVQWQPISYGTRWSLSLVIGFLLFVLDLIWVLLVDLEEQEIIRDLLQVEQPIHRPTAYLQPSASPAVQPHVQRPISRPTGPIDSLVNRVHLFLLSSSHRP